MHVRWICSFRFVCEDVDVFELWSFIVYKYDYVDAVIGTGVGSGFFGMYYTMFVCFACGLEIKQF